METYSENQIAPLFIKATEELKELVKSGTVPNTIKSFSEIHDHIDANTLGGFCEEGYEPSENLEIENEVQCRVDAWIKNGRLEFETTTLPPSAFSEIGRAKLNS